MSPEKTQELINIYPDLFSNLDRRNCFFLFSFECDSGWFELLKELITEIKAIAEKEDCMFSDDDEPRPLKVCQVKEKYGSLCFYTNWSNDFIDEAIGRYEKKSMETCEICGLAGSIKDTGYYCYKTLCDKCSSCSS